MRVISDEHAAEVQLLDLARLERERWLLFGAGKSADHLACLYLDEEVRRATEPEPSTERKAA